ncbi:nucleotide-diphospho-sugar transferase [Tirmania nivea]|nr:nucleotide-diphospho-sugar transferase [Tirmania nivea]
MGFLFPSSVEDYLALGEAAYFLVQDNPSVVVTLVLGIAVAAVLALYILLLLVAHFPRRETDSECTYLTVAPSGEISGPQPLPNTTDYLSNSTVTPSPSDPPVYVSVIVPAFNESLRLPLMLAEAVDFLTQNYTTLGWEILLVDDGSNDNTSQSALAWVQSYLKSHSTTPFTPSSIRVITLTKNRGKGGAVTHGMRHARGAYTIFADADGATRFSDLSALLAALQSLQSTPPKSPSAIAVGSRAHMVHTAAVVQRSFIRNLLMYTFHFYLGVMGISSIKDTQCGFKLFSREAAVTVFRGMYTEGWIFDVEILLRAERAGIKVAEVPVNWHEVEGTKMELVRDSVVMALDLLILRAGYATGVYQYAVGA